MAPLLLRSLARLWSIRSRARNFVLLGVCLGGGLGVSLLVSWGCAYCSHWRGIGSAGIWRDAEAAQRGWPCEVPPDWPPPQLAQHHRRFGVDVLTASAYTIITYRKPTETFVAVHLVRAGWPMRALVSAKVRGPGAPRVRAIRHGPVRVSWSEGLDVQTRLASGAGYTIDIPLAPIPLGLAVNSVTYGAVIWVLAAAALRRRHLGRVRRGVCPRCVYPCSGLPRCPECGHIEAQESTC